MEKSPSTNPIAVIALGGHAFLRSGKEPTHEEHKHNAALISKILMDLVERDYNIVITHGNGPQVGNLLIQNEVASGEIPPQPLDVLVAMTEGSLGYILQEAMLNEMRSRRIRRYVETIVTQVIVDPNDPAFHNPTKPIGPFYDREEAERREKELGWKLYEDAGRGWRRRVPSPKPIKVIQRHTIRDSARTGHIVIAAGGGGIPVIKAEDGRYQGVEAVIDKDLTAALLAREVEAEIFIILTAVEQVYINFKTPQQQPLGALTIEMTRHYLDEGHFPAGSMGPKIEAVLQFLESGGKRALITSPEALASALEGKTGTHFVGRL